MTKEDFIRTFSERSGVDPDVFHKRMVAMECCCGPCDGWAAVPNNPQSITRHEEHYGPGGRSRKGVHPWSAVFDAIEQDYTTIEIVGNVLVFGPEHECMSRVYGVEFQRYEDTA